MMTTSKTPFFNSPIPKYGDYIQVPGEDEVYPIFRGQIKSKESNFFADLIIKNNSKKIIDFGVGGGKEFSAIMEIFEKRGYKLKIAEANEIDDKFISQAKNIFKSRGQNVPIHQANWENLPTANPPYNNTFDFGLLTGNSLSYIGGKNREDTLSKQKNALAHIATLLEPNGRLFVDTRNFDFIFSLSGKSISDIESYFDFGYTVYYHGAKKNISAFPVFIERDLVIFHYYYHDKKIWCKKIYFPIYHKDMLDMLSKIFLIKNIYSDFKAGFFKKSIFLQYLVCKK